MKNIAVILAGGIGYRMNGALPKQFLKVAGKKIIEHTIDIFEKNTYIDEICIVCHEAYIYIIEDIIITNQYKKVKKILSGGNERYKSSLVAINAYTDNMEKNILFHDAVRPLVSQTTINECIKALDRYDAVDVAIKTTDTIISVATNNIIESIPDRDKLYNGQTPQAFKLSIIKKAYDIALCDPNFRTTDDCGVIKKYLPDTSIYVVNGSLNNIKVTYPEDIFLLDKLFQLHTLESSSFFPIDHQKLANTVTVIFGGNSGIGKEIDEYLKKNNLFTYSFSRSTTNTDISCPEQVEDALKMIDKKHQRIDNIIITAGVLKKEPLIVSSYKDITESINNNYLGNIIVAKAGYPYLKKTKGHLLFFTSSSYTRGRSLYSMYSSSKAAVVNLAQALSEEWCKDGIKVNCINPERTRTPMRVKNFGNENTSLLLRPEAVAEAAIAIITSDYSGEVIDVRLQK